jgi:hypothetical protein
MPPELVKLLGALAAPVWVLTIFSVALMTVKGTLWIKHNGNGNGSRTTATAQASILAAVTSLATALTQLDKQVGKQGEETAGQLDGIREELRGILRILDRTEIRLETLACREDIAEIAEKNRAVTRAGFEQLAAQFNASTREVAR